MTFRIIVTAWLLALTAVIARVAGIAGQRRGSAVQDVPPGRSFGAGCDPLTYSAEELAPFRMPELQ